MLVWTPLIWGLSGKSTWDTHPSDVFSADRGFWPILFHGQGRSQNGWSVGESGMYMHIPSLLGGLEHVFIFSYVGNTNPKEYFWEGLIPPTRSALDRHTDVWRCFFPKKRGVFGPSFWCRFYVHHLDCVCAANVTSSTSRFKKGALNPASISWPPENSLFWLVGRLNHWAMFFFRKVGRWLVGGDSLLKHIGDSNGNDHKFNRHEGTLTFLDLCISFAMD